MGTTSRHDPAESRRETFGHGLALAAACFVTFVLITRGLSRVHGTSASDDKLGGMWAVVATVFVYRQSFPESMTEAWSRMSATLVSFALCFLYLIVFPFSGLGLAVLIGLGFIVVTLIGRPQDAVTTGITTAVVMVVAGLGPRSEAWQQPLLRVVDTVVGVLVGLAAARLALLVARRAGTQAAMPASAAPAGTSRPGPAT